MTCGIYKITNLINGKAYIGQSINIKRRWRDEKMAAQNSSKGDYDSVRSKAIRKYGIENFSFEIIEECSREKLNEREGYWATYYNTYIPNGYNVARCGQNHFVFNKLDMDTLLEIIEKLRETKESEIDIAKYYGVSLDTISKINVGARCKLDFIEYPIRSRVSQKVCKNCGVFITGSQFCSKCSHLMQRKAERPHKDVLLQEIVQNGFEATGRKYGVSGNAIKKWCKAYDLPTKKNELKELYESRLK